MVLLTVEQAARRLNRTERTVRRWVKDGKLSEHHPPHGHTTKFLVDEQEVELLAHELAEYEQPGPVASRGDIESLDRRVAWLEHEIARLTSLIPGIEGEALPESPERATGQDTKLGRPPATGRAAEPPVDLPRGSMLIKDFAELHGVNRRTFQDHITKGLKGEQVATTNRPKPGRQNELERWLTPEQQVATIAFWQRHAVTYTHCAHCPHGQEVTIPSDLSEERQETGAIGNP